MYTYLLSLFHFITASLHLALSPLRYHRFDLILKFFRMRVRILLSPSPHTYRPYGRVYNSSSLSKLFPTLHGFFPNHHIWLSLHNHIWRVRFLSQSLFFSALACFKLSISSLRFSSSILLFVIAAFLSPVSAASETERAQHGNLSLSRALSRKQL